MEKGQTVFRKVLDANPGSIHALARAAGVSEKLLRMIRDGDRRLTPETRAVLAAALRRWSGELAEVADALERCNLEPGGEGE